MTEKGGAVITERQLRNDSRGRGGIYVKREKKKMRCAVSKQSLRARHRQQRGAVRRCYHTGRDLQKYNSANDTLKCSRGRSRQEGD